MPQLLIGTSGYDYPEWKGVFYPDNLARKDFLAYYATQFNALELNNTFYNMPTPERMQSFYDRTSGNVAFSVKANRTLTHEVTHHWNADADLFKAALQPLAQTDTLSAVLFQFPQSFHYTPDNRIYLAKIIDTFTGYPVVIEFRHREWIRESVFEGLSQRNTGIVFCDMPQLQYLPDGFAARTPFISDKAYIRLHGRNENAWYAHTSDHNGSSRYDYDYSDEELKAFVPIVQTALQEGRKTQVYFNNHPKGSGVKNAMRMKELL